MRKIAFIIAIVGLFILTIYLDAKPKVITFQEELQNLEVNTKVIFKSKVVEESVLYKNTKLITFDNGIKAKTEIQGSLKNKIVTVIGLIEKEPSLQVNVLEINN